MSESLHDEVIRVARDLIRFDTTNAREPGPRQRDAVRGVSPRLPLRVRRRVRAGRPRAAPGQPGGADPGSRQARPTDTGEGPSLAFVGHTDVVPCDPRDWTHPPFEAVLDDDGWLWGRGAIDMKNEVAARAVAMAELARSGFRPRGDLWFLAVADEEDGFDDVGMRWLLEERTDIRPDPQHQRGRRGAARISPTAASWSGSRWARRARCRCGSPRSARPGTPPCRPWATTPYRCWPG